MGSDRWYRGMSCLRRREEGCQSFRVDVHGGSIVTGQIQTLSRCDLWLFFLNLFVLSDRAERMRYEDSRYNISNIGAETGQRDGPVFVPVIRAWEHYERED